MAIYLLPGETMRERLTIKQTVGNGNRLRYGVALRNKTSPILRNSQYSLSIPVCGLTTMKFD
ncbi:MAG: hypothetical protein CMI06_03975 [Oceanospirillaceae bacterium]|nr:hypothetical protein [Oceanospirillaceae bacterium]